MSFIKSKSKLIVMLMIVILLFGIGSSFASADVDDDVGVASDVDTVEVSNEDTTVVQQQNTQEDKVLTASESENLGSSNNISSAEEGKLQSINNNDILADDDSVGSITDLAQLIKFSDGLLVLDKNYEYKTTDSESIVISKPITIDGNGFNIKSNDIDTLINVNGNNVIIKNLNFIDSGNKGSQIIYWNGDNGQIVNCYFKNIVSTMTIRFDGHNESISNCKFDNAKYILCSSLNVNNTDFRNINDVFGENVGGNLNVYNSNFTNIHRIIYTVRSTAYFENIRVLNSNADLTSSTVPAFISIKDYSIIKNSYFEGNSGTSILGGGILVYNSTFKSNTAKYMVSPTSGGGYYTSATVDGCTFIDNKNALFDPMQANFKILNSVFKNNTITSITVTQHSFIMDNCTFINNTASGNALITFSSNADKSRIVNSKFINNKGFSKAPVYISKGSSYLDNNIFTNNINSASVDSTVVNDVGTVFTPRDVIYVSPNGKGDGSINNRANLTNALSLVSFGGTIYLEDGEYNDFTNRISLYANIIGEQNGVIINKGSFANYLYNGIIKNITFYDMQNPIASSITYTNIINCTFSNYNKTNVIFSTGGFNYAHGHKFINITISNSKISQFLEYYNNYQTLEYTFENIYVIESTVTGYLIDFGTVGNNVIKNLNGIKSNFSNYVLNFRYPTYGVAYGYIIDVDGLNFEDCVFEKNIIYSGNTYSASEINDVVVTDCTTKDTLFVGVNSIYSNIVVKNSNKEYSSDIFSIGVDTNSISDVVLENLNVGSIITSTGSYNINGLNVSDVSGNVGFKGIAGTNLINLDFNNVVFSDAIGILYDNTILEQSSFVKCVGNIQVNGSDVLIRSTTFKNGKSNSAHVNGGAIELVSGDEFIINDCTFDGNSAYNGGAVYINDVTNSSYILKSIFRNNIATGTAGGAVFIKPGISYYIDSDTRAYFSNTLKNNDLCDKDTIETLDDVWVIWNGNGDGSYGSPTDLSNGLALVSPYGTIHFYESEFKYSVYTLRELNKPGLKFLGSNSIMTNIAFHVTSNANSISFSDLIFENYVDGSVLIWDGNDGKIVNSTFRNNGGDEINYGAAIKLNGDNLFISDSKFISNSAINDDDLCYGGAIYVNASGLTISNTNFSDNVVHGYGVHIYLSENSHDILICNGSTFNGGRVTGNGQGSGIYILSEYNVVISDSTFTNNVGTNGGALCFNSIIATVKIYNNTFTSNAASNNGGAIAFMTNSINALEMNNNTYKSNTAGNYGGAIYSNVPINVEKSVFTSNRAAYGGAIYLNAAGSSISGSTFTDNSASNYRNIYSSVSVAPSLSGNTFNGATYTINSISNGNYPVDVVVSGTFDDGNNFATEIPVLANNVEVTSITTSNSNSYSANWNNVLPNNYRVVVANVDNYGNKFVFTTTPSVSFSVTRRNVIYVGNGAIGKGTSASDPIDWDSVADILSNDGTIYFTSGTYTNFYNKVISGSWTLKPVDGATVILDANNKGRIFSITANNVNIEGFTFQNGKVTTGSGGAIYNTGTGVTIKNSIFTGNTAPSANIIGSTKTITISNSQLKNPFSITTSNVNWGSDEVITITFPTGTAPSTGTILLNGVGKGTYTVSNNQLQASISGLTVGSYVVTQTRVISKEDL